MKSISEDLLMIAVIALIALIIVGILFGSLKLSLSLQEMAGLI